MFGAVRPHTLQNGLKNGLEVSYYEMSKDYSDVILHAHEVSKTFQWINPGTIQSTSYVSPKENTEDPARSS